MYEAIYNKYSALQQL